MLLQFVMSLWLFDKKSPCLQDANAGSSAQLLGQFLDYLS